MITESAQFRCNAGNTRHLVSFTGRSFTNAHGIPGNSELPVIWLTSGSLSSLYFISHAHLLTAH